MAQSLITVLLLQLAVLATSDRPTPRRKGQADGSSLPLMLHEIEPKGSRPKHEVHRMPPQALTEGSASTGTKSEIIGGVFVWLEALYMDLVGPPPVLKEGEPYEMPPGITKDRWFDAAFSGKWAWGLWDLFDVEQPFGVISKGEMTRLWSSSAMRAEFGSPYTAPHISDYNGYLECMAYTVLSYRMWDADENGELSVEEMGNTSVWQLRLVDRELFTQWAANFSLYPDGFMAMLFNNFAKSDQLTGGFHADGAVQQELKTDREKQEVEAHGGKAASPGDAPVDNYDITDIDFSLDAGLWFEAIHQLLDLDGNRVLSTREWYLATSHGRWADTLWHHMDANEDGKLQMHEFQSKMPEAMLTQFGGSAPIHGDPLNAYFSYVTLSILIFRRLDTNKDGHLVWSEIKGTPLERQTKKEDKPECADFAIHAYGVMTQRGFNLISGNDGKMTPRLELEELTGLFAELFYRGAKYY